MAIEIVSLATLAKRLGISRAWVYHLYQTKGITPDFVDDRKRSYWSEKKVKKYIEMKELQQGLSRKVKRVYE